MEKQINISEKKLKQMVANGEYVNYINYVKTYLKESIDFCRDKITDGKDIIITDIRNSNIGSLNEITNSQAIPEKDLFNKVEKVLIEMFTTCEPKKCFYNRRIEEYNLIIRVSAYYSANDNCGYINMDACFWFGCTGLSLFEINMEIYNKEKKDEKFIEELINLDLTEDEMNFFKSEYKECTNYYEKNLEHINELIRDSLNKRFVEYFNSKENDLTCDSRNIKELVYKESLLQYLSNETWIKNILRFLDMKIMYNSITINYFNKKVFGLSKRTEYLIDMD